MERPERSRYAAPLANRVGEGANAAQLAEGIVATWRDIDTVFTPLLGKRGVAALYNRGVYLSASSHPWLASTHEGAQGPMDLVALKTLLCKQNSDDIAAAGSALLQTFHELLATLVGDSLAERLLRPVWANSLGNPPTQETPP